MPPDKKNPFDGYAKYSSMVFQMGAIIFGGIYLGIWLDKKYEMKKPIFTTSLALFSIFLAMYVVIREFIKKK